jgi:hypothetical protein
LGEARSYWVWAVIAPTCAADFFGGGGEACVARHRIRLRPDASPGLQATSSRPGPTAGALRRRRWSNSGQLFRGLRVRKIWNVFPCRGANQVDRGRDAILLAKVPFSRLNGSDGPGSAGRSVTALPRPACTPIFLRCCALAPRLVTGQPPDSAASARLRSRSRGFGPCRRRSPVRAPR